MAKHISAKSCRSLAISYEAYRSAKKEWRKTLSDEAGVAVRTWGRILMEAQTATGVELVPNHGIEMSIGLTEKKQAS